MAKITIAIPTYKRWHRLIGKDYFKSAIYVLPHSQRNKYAAVTWCCISTMYSILSKKRMIVIPDKHDGSIAKKRNWILDNIERPLVMIDDDKRIRRF